MRKTERVDPNLAALADQPDFIILWGKTPKIHTRLKSSEGSEMVPEDVENLGLVSLL